MRKAPIGEHGLAIISYNGQGDKVTKQVPKEKKGGQGAHDATGISSANNLKEYEHQCEILYVAKSANS